MRSAATGPPAACTIIARNYLSYATILAESYLTHEPGARFYLLVVDELPEEARVPPGVEVITPRELGLPSFFEMCFKYDVTELCTAVKPAFLSLLLTHYAETSVIYFDPDILVMRPLEELESAMAAADIVLIPHLLDPIPRDGRKPSEQDILIAGAYNLGFLGLRRSEATGRLLDWWADRLQDGCRVDPAHGLFVDQRWMDLVPGLFPTATVLRDDTYDVAYWNIHSRMPERQGSELLVNGRPLAFFHFSGFDPRQPQVLSKHQTRTIVQQGSALADLLNRYAELHREQGHEVSSRWPYGYSRFSNGVPVNTVFRRLYLALDDATRQGFGNPFEISGPGSFLEWATGARAEVSGLSPFLEKLYEVRADLPSAFPDVRGKDRLDFLEWARTQGAREMGYPPEIVPINHGAGAGSTAGDATARLSGRVSLPGVNVAGYLRNETGLGAVARGYVSALRRAGAPVALKDLSSLSPNRSEDPTLETFDEVHPHPVNLLCVNADQHFVVASHLGDAFLRGRRNIAVWFWECPEFPSEWHDRFAQYDEIWAPSSFIANTLAAVSPIPVVRMPAVLGEDGVGARERGRARLDAGPGEFVWLFIFDFHSYFERKNVLGLIDAFKRAFAPSDPVRLVIKCVNSAFDPDAHRALEASARGCRVTIHDGYWSAGEMQDLLAACDGYASLHRSEGLGVPLASAMRLGKPVVATDWSGNTDFMTVSNSFPVRYELAKLASDVGPYRAGSTWAEPSVEHAAELLRLVFEGGEEVAARAEAGRRTIEAQYSVQAVARCLHTRLAVIGGQLATRSTSEAVPSPATASSASSGNRYDLTPALPPLDLQTSQHGRWGRWGKRAAGLLLRYHSFHQQRVNAILAGSIGDVAARLANLSERLDRSDIQRREDHQAGARAVAALESGAGQTAARLERVESVAQRADQSAAAARRAQDDAIGTVRRSIQSLDARLDQAFARFDRWDSAAALADETAAVVRGVQQRLDALSNALQSLERGVEQAFERFESATLLGEQTAAAVRKAQEGIDGTAALAYETAAGLRDLRERIDAATDSICSLDSRFKESTTTLDLLQSAAGRSDELARHVGQSVEAVDALKAQASSTEHLLQAVRERLEAVAEKVAHVGYRFAVRPYMGVDPFGATGDLDAPMGYGPGTPAGDVAEPPTFEDVFRGPERLVAERQRQYLGLLDGAKDIVDLGCGRGEFLGLVSRRGVRAVGVEKSASLAAHCRAKGLKVVRGDALQYLRKRSANSLDVIFSAQFIEHVTPEELVLLLALSRTRLRKGGLFIAETPNPESFEALKTFHVDLTHQKPIYPQVLLHLCLEQGFESARIFYPLGGGFTQRQYESAGEYAVVAAR